MPDTSPDDARVEWQDRSAKIEELLLAGLDHYFAGEHDRAINVWTRVLFLDRGHARARAYIDRARGALAEHQRHSDELIQRGIAAFELGHTGEARELLSSAIRHGGPHDVALALLERLDRLEVATAGFEDARVAGAAKSEPQAGKQDATPSTWPVIAGLALVLIVAVLYVVVSSPDRSGLPTARTGPRAGSPARSSQESLSVPRPADVALSRARSLAASGHLKDALAALEPIAPGDPAHPDAQRLRADIQSSLLAGLPPLRPRQGDRD